MPLMLGDLDPSIEVRRDDRFVDHGDGVTSSGVCAGIGMALYLGHPVRPGAADVGPNSSADDEVSARAAYGVPVIEQRRGPVLRAFALLVLLAAVVLPGVASAHESLPTGVQRLELSLGERELALTVTAPPDGGGLVPVVVLPRGDAPPGEVTLAAVRPGGDPAAGAPVTVPAAPVGQPREVALRADAPGEWEVVVADGATVARIPLTVAAPAPTPGWVWAVRIGAVLGVVALIAALAPAVRARPRLAAPLGAVALVAVTVAVTAAITEPAGPSEPGPAAAPVS
ncbi:MAG TPA: hypothetical protein VK935_10155, partial [Actinomycetospora sp.]|nr:hypothetical protein [Actinomycetospora sp.]